LYYPTREAYETAVRRAAAYAALQRWILVDDIDDVVRQALARTAQFPGCVPEH
jgi:hypothetical protein